MNSTTHLTHPNPTHSLKAWASEATIRKTNRIPMARPRANEAEEAKNGEDTDEEDEDDEDDDDDVIVL